MKDDTVRHLIALGFTDLEARIYIALISHGSATGYSVAQIIDKPTANTYKGLASLQRKGFVLTDKGKKKRFVATAVKEVMSRLDREFQDRRKKTEDSLSSLAGPGWDQNVYQLESVAQVYEQFRAMISRAQRSILSDLSPAPFDQLSDELVRSGSRGRQVIVKVYRDVSLPHVKTVRNASYSDEGLLQKGQWMSIVIDSEECCLAYISSQGELVHQALWSKSLFLSSAYYHGLMSELAMDELAAMIPQDSLNAPAKRVLRRYITREGYAQLPGIRKLMKSIT